MYSYDFKVYSHNVFNGLILSFTGRGKGNERKIRKKNMFSWMQKIGWLRSRQYAFKNKILGQRQALVYIPRSNTTYREHILNWILRFTANTASLYIFPRSEQQLHQQYQIYICNQKSKNSKGRFRIRGKIILKILGRRDHRLF